MSITAKKIKWDNSDEVVIKYAERDTNGEIIDIGSINDSFSDVDTALNQKVDKVSGKGLSTEDFTSAEKTKLSGIASGANVNTIESITLNGTTLTPINKQVDIQDVVKCGGSLGSGEIVLGDGNLNCATNYYKIGDSSITWTDSSDVYVPTMKSVSSQLSTKLGDYTKTSNLNIREVAIENNIINIGVAGDIIRDSNYHCTGVSRGYFLAKATSAYDASTIAFQNNNSYAIGKLGYYLDRDSSSIVTLKDNIVAFDIYFAHSGTRAVSYSGKVWTLQQSGSAYNIVSELIRGTITLGTALTASCTFTLSGPTTGSVISSYGDWILSYGIPLVMVP